MAKTLFKSRLTMSNTEGRSDVTFSRWTKYGKDRVYVTYGSKGHSAGYIDVAGETPEYICESKFDRNVVIDCVNTFLSKYRFNYQKEAAIMSTIYKANQKALEEGWDWDTIFANDAIETVAEFETMEEAEEAFENGGYDPDLYGVF